MFALSKILQGHIPRSIFIGIDGNFAQWVGAMIVDTKQAILIVADQGREEETITRLSRVGFDNTLGFLEGGFEAWRKAGKEYDSVGTVSTAKFKEALAQDTHYPVFDVRKENEYKSEHIEIANNTPLDFLNKHLAEFPIEESFYLHCAGGYRSMIAASILKSRGIHNIIDVEGGFAAIKEAGIKTTDYVCPSTLL